MHRRAPVSPMRLARNTDVPLWSTSARPRTAAAAVTWCASRPVQSSPVNARPDSLVSPESVSMLTNAAPDRRLAAIKRAVPTLSDRLCAAVRSDIRATVRPARISMNAAFLAHVTVSRGSARIPPAASLAPALEVTVATESSAFR